MKTETVKDILQWTAAYHRAIAESLEQCGEESAEPRMRMLLDYLEQHEKQLAQVIDRFESSSALDELNTWCFEYMQENPIELRLDALHRAYKNDPEGLFMDVMGQHRQLIDMYRYLDGRFGHSPAHELLLELLELEEHEAMRMSQSANRLHDL